MAPTICDDEFGTSIHRHRHHRPYSVISYGECQCFPSDQILIKFIENINILNNKPIPIIFRFKLLIELELSF